MLKDIDEAELVRVINKVVDKLASKFRFGYHDIEDIKQEGRLFALQCLDRYDNKRPLDNFIYTHVRNRLINFKRDNYSRYDKPCHSCIFYDPHHERSSNQCAEFSDKMCCDRWAVWVTRNDAKRGLMEPLSIDNGINNVYDIPISNFELVNLIKEHIPVALRADYLRMLDGCTLSKQRRERVQEAVLTILRNHHWQTQED